MTEKQRAEKIIRSAFKLAKASCAEVLIVLGLLSGISNLAEAGVAAMHSVDLGSECHIQAAIPFGGIMGGSFDLDTQTNGGGFTIRKFPQEIANASLFVNMKCFNVSELNFPRDKSVRFDEKTQRWKKDFSEREYANTAENYKRLNYASHVYTIHAKNSSGYVYTEDDMIGEESRRDRNMSFCLLRPPKALCGNGIVMRLSDPKSDTLPYVFQILKSMEFIEDAPETAGIADEK